ncbi:testis-expressed protein 13A [Vicugna pacos]|uniref:Testis-expressed protein 13A n=1 Tax=Vicugna pacos TaxID=30538 RepID=A0ABM5CWB7_VICPA
MALKPEDLSGGFQHGKVVAFINEKMARHAKGPEFYLENTSLSWEEVEAKLNAILEDTEVSSEAKEACAWGSLALGVRFAHRQNQLNEQRMQCLHDFARLQRSAAQALASDLKLLTAQREVEHNEAASQLWLAQASLAEMRKERDLLRWKLFQAELGPLRERVAEGPGLATATGAGTGAGEVEEKAEATATSASASGATGGGGGGRQEEEEDTDDAEAMEKLGEDLMQLLGAADQKNYTSSRQREGNLRSLETPMVYLSGAKTSRSTVSPELLPVQLPASFTYSYSSPLSPFPDTPIPSPPTTSPPAATFTAGALPQTSPHWGPSDVSLWANMGALGINPREPQRERRDSDPHPQRRQPVYRRPGDWDCPWCKAVNFSRRETCFRCGRGIWLQTPQ